MRFTIGKIDIVWITRRLSGSGTALNEFGFTAVSLLQIHNYFGLVLTYAMGPQTLTLAILSTLTLEPKTLILSVSIGVLAIRILAFSTRCGWCIPGFLFNKNPDKHIKKYKTELIWIEKTKKQCSRSRSGWIRNFVQTREISSDPDLGSSGNDKLIKFPISQQSVQLLKNLNCFSINFL